MMLVSLLLFLLWPTAVLAGSMDLLDWGGNNQAELIFCEGNNGAFGYKLNSGDSCDPAGVLVRMSPGQTYHLTLRNDASQVTNLHTHGLHISGDGNSDDPRRLVNAGNCLLYVWDIPQEHMGGTYWMHAHAHEHTEEQVSGGAFAMLIIEENSQVIQDNGIPSNDIEAWYNNELLLVASKVGNTALGNGLPDYDIPMIKDEWYRMRIVAVDPNGKSSDLEFPISCEVRAVAHDGVWRFEVPKSVPSTTYELTGASRLDVAIKCTSDGDFDVDFGRRKVATLSVSSGTTSNASPFHDGGSWASYRPDYLQDLSSYNEDIEYYEISMTAAQINGESYDPDSPLGDWNIDTYQEWTIKSTNAHPYHLHVYHMQAVSGCGGGVHDDGEYYDTISVNSDCVVRFQMRDHGGSVMMHCHVLSHEDNGSMTWANVIGGPAPDPYRREQEACPGSTPLTPSPTPRPSPAPTPSPTDSGPSCAAVGESCRDDENCCSNDCSRGNPATRFCLPDRFLRG